MGLLKKVLLIMLTCLLVSCDNKQYPSPMEETPSPVITDVYSISSPEKETLSDQENAIIDISNKQQGYITARKISSDDLKLKLQIIKDDVTYNYDILTSEITAYPLQQGNGSYTIRIMKQVKDDSYIQMLSEPIDVQLENELLPYLYPSQIVSFKPEDPAIQMAFELTKGSKTKIERIYSIYEYVIENITYDDEKAEEVAGKFVLPDINNTMETKRGICFDYAALLTAMLRSQQIPSRLIMGYTEEEYHSWVEIWLDEEGWVDPHVFFEKEEWSKIDPTYAAAKKNYDGVYETKKIY